MGVHSHQVQYSPPGREALRSTRDLVAGAGMRHLGMGWDFGSLDDLLALAGFVDRGVLDPVRGHGRKHFPTRFDPDDMNDPGDALVLQWPPKYCPRWTMAVATCNCAAHDDEQDRRGGQRT